MKKIFNLLLIMMCAVCAHAQNSIISATPEGTLYPTVYGGSAKTYLVSQGGFGSFSDNYGYRSSIVIDGDDVYIHNVIREYPGLDSWVKGRFVSSDVVEFQFPQPVAMDSKTNEPIFAAMLKPERTPSGVISLVQDTESPCLRLRSNEARDSFTQIMPDASDSGLSSYSGMIGLVNAKGVFLSYAEQNVSYTIWSELPADPSKDLEVSTYTAAFTDSWNDSFKRLVKIGFDGEVAWIGGLCAELPDAWIKGAVQEDGSILIDTKQYLGVTNDYLCFMCCLQKEGSKDFSMASSVVLNPVEGGYKASAPMAFNLGFTRVFLGVAVQNLTLTMTTDSLPIPVSPVFGEPEWSDEDGMGIADVLILPEDVNGQALDPDNLYYRVYFDGELAALEYDGSGNPVTDLKYGQESDLIIFMYDWHFILFLEPLKSLGVQSVYKVDGQEYCSDIVTYDFPQSGVSGLTDREVESISYWTLDGRPIDHPAGMCIRKVVYTDGTSTTSKIVKK